MHYRLEETEHGYRPDESPAPAAMNGGLADSALGRSATVRGPWRIAAPALVVARCLALSLGLFLVACSPGEDDEGGIGAALGPDGMPSNDALAAVVRPWTGDLDGMIERRYLRLLTVNSPVLYFVDRGQQRGIVYDWTRGFETHLNAALERRLVKVHVIVLPVGRDELIPRLIEGYGDLAIAQLTITPERAAAVDFSIPVMRDVAEVLVTGPASEPVSSIDDLAGREVYLRMSSSYAEHLAALNARFAQNDRPLVRIRPADELLEAGDILEMVNAGLVPASFVDQPVAELYEQVLEDLVVHDDIVLHAGAETGWAFRKDSPQLATMVNDFLTKNRQGTLIGNVVLDRYLGDTRWIENARDEQSMARYRSTLALFRKYAERYNLDPLLLVAQAYQESGLDHSRRSRAGAVGIMQMLPSTARDKNVGIPDISGLENNIHAGAKYLSWIMDRYFSDSHMTRFQQELFGLAAYNAGPARVARLRSRAAAQGLDPDQWFNNVEIVAAREIGRETVQYVANIYKYYLTYVAFEANNMARDNAGS
jgi:membrane-bound lytic murein transglycosylase MltF